MKKINYTTLFSLLVTTAIAPVYAMESQEDDQSRNTAVTQKSGLEKSSQSKTQSSSLFRRHFKRDIGTEFIINQVKTRDQDTPSVASLTNGTVFVAWSGSQSGNDNIYGRVFNGTTGTALSDEFTINQVTTGYQFYPSVASLTNGKVFVAWTGSQSGSNEIYGRVFNGTTGTAVSDEFILNQVKTGEQFYPSVAGLTNGNVLVAWYGDQSGDDDIYGRVFNGTTGNALSEEFTINQVTTGNQQRPSVAGLINEAVFVAWRGRQSGDNNIYGRVFNGTKGTALSDEFTINQVTTGNQPKSSVTSLADGTVFVAWEGGQSGNDNIYGRVFNGTKGTALSDEFIINQVTTALQIYPFVASLTNGNVFVAWSGTQSGNYNNYGRVFNGTTGTAVSDEFTINQVTTGEQKRPSVASLTNGNVFVAWSGTQSGNYDIYGIIQTGDGPSGTPPGYGPIIARLTEASPSSAHRLTPNWLIPARVIVGGVKNFWDPATIKNEQWKNLGVNLDETKNVETKESPTVSRPLQAYQKVMNYVNSWFSSRSWNEYFDSVEKSVLDYSKSMVEETPSYHTAPGQPILVGNAPLAGLNASYNSGACYSMGYLPYTVVSGAIGQ